MNNNLQEFFLSYLEGTLSEEDKNNLNREFEKNSSLKEEYQEFVLAYDAVNSMIHKNVKAPIGFDLDVMKEIDKLSPVIKRRSSMRSIEESLKGFFNRKRFIYLLAPSFASIALIMIILKVKPDTIEMLHKNQSENHPQPGFYSTKGEQEQRLNEQSRNKTTAQALEGLEDTIGGVGKRTQVLDKSPKKQDPNDLNSTGDLSKDKIKTPSEDQVDKDVELSSGVNASTDGTLYPPAFKAEKEADSNVVRPETKQAQGLKAEDQFTDLIIAFKNDKEKGTDSTVEIGAQLKPSKKEAELLIQKNFAADAKTRSPVGAAGVIQGADGGYRVVNRSYTAPAPMEKGDDYYETAVTKKAQTVENAYQTAVSTPLSTFSIDVDTASYSNIRRQLSNSQMPSKDSVRIEELLNYFDYDYKVPSTKEVPFSVITEMAACPWEPKHRLLHVGMKGYEENTNELPASNLVFLIDVSGSMNSPDKLPLLKQGFRLLVDQLKPKDRIAIVVYAGAAGVVLDSKDGNQKSEILAALDNLSAGGSTAGGAGIELAYKIAKDHFIKGANNRVILATDGDFNVGASSDEELVTLIEEKRKSGIFLSVLGFGTGNFQDDKMEQLANKGNGNYAYIDSILEAKKVLVNDFKGTLFTIAKDVKIQIEFNPAYVQAYRLIGYENRMLAKEDFNDDKKDAGELGAGHSVTALYEIVPVGVEFNQVPSVDALKYQQVAASPSPAATPAPVLNDELATVKLRYKLPDGDQSKLISQVVSATPVAEGSTSTNFRFSSSVAEFGMLLRGSEYKGSANYDSAMNLAKGAKGEDKFGYRSDFIKLVESAGLLDKK